MSLKTITIIFTLFFLSGCRIFTPYPVEKCETFEVPPTAKESRDFFEKDKKRRNKTYYKEPLNTKLTKEQKNRNNLNLK